MKLSYCLCAVLFINFEQILSCSSDEISIVREKINKIDHIIHEILDLISRKYKHYEVIPEKPYETPTTVVTEDKIVNKKKLHETPTTVVTEDKIVNKKKLHETPTIVETEDNKIVNKKIYEKPKDCSEIKENGDNKSGIYEVWPLNKKTKPFSFKVYCDMETDGGGWTVFQRRGDFGNPKDYFLRNWKNYSEGFGKLDEDFWLGNEKLYYLTNQGTYSMRIDMKDKEGNHRYAKFQEFKISSEKDLYELHVAGYSGNAGDSLTLHHNKQKFSTIDKDNDKASYSSCASFYKGAWWYYSCYDSNLNGLYLNGPHKSYGDGVEWYAWKGLQYSLPDVEMKIRRA